MLKFALLLMIVLTGCANYSWVSVSDNGNYDFFQNGKLVCESTSSCRIGSSWGDKMLLEIRKGDVTYAHLVVFSKEKKRDDVDYDTERFVGKELFEHWESQPHSQGDVMVAMVAGGAAVTGYLLAKPISMIILHNITELPSNITIPIGHKIAEPFPWDKPAKD